MSHEVPCHRKNFVGLVVGRGICQEFDSLAKQMPVGQDGCDFFRHLMLNGFTLPGWIPPLTMPRLANELKPVHLRHLNEPGRYAVGGVPGLLFHVRPSGSKHWILRVSVGGRRRDIGLGGFPAVGLSEARDRAREHRDKIRRGIDPVAERKQAEAELRKARLRNITFREAALRCHHSKSQEFRSVKHRHDWINSLERYAFPRIGNHQIQDIGLPEVLQILEPIWTTRTETATRVRQRLESVLTWATVSGYRSGDNPARWDGNLKEILPLPSKIARVKHFPALPWRRIPEFMADLRSREGQGARALEFLIYTATRTGEVRQARWDQVNWNEKTWDLPGEAMKNGRPHRIPLPDPVMTLLESIPRIDRSPYLFAAPNGGMISNATMSAVIKRMHRGKLASSREGYIDSDQDRVAVPHGFRSAFKDWARTETDFRDEVSELALAHVNSDTTRAAYARDELLEKRKELMVLWGSYCMEGM